jgi:hypothetical protein
MALFFMISTVHAAGVNHDDRLRTCATLAQSLAATKRPLAFDGVTGRSEDDLWLKSPRQLFH